MKWVDTHAHYDSHMYNSDRESLLNEVYKDVSYIINCATRTSSIKSTLRLVNEYKDKMYGVIGYFPVDVGELEKNPSNMGWLKSLIQQNKRIVGIGEIGLDYHWNSIGYKENQIIGEEARELQKKWFIKQIELANELKMPICVHSRDAAEDTVAILEQHKPQYGFIVHCFSYDAVTAYNLMNIGDCYFGVGGTSTYKSNVALIDALTNVVPIDRVLLETDAPFLTPAPKRKDRNDSRYISYVIDNLAKIKGITKEEVINITNENVLKAYPRIAETRVVE